MAGTSQGQSNQTITQTTNRILEAGSMSRYEHFQLMAMFLNNLVTNEKERYLINRVLDELQMGKIELRN